MLIVVFQHDCFFVTGTIVNFSSHLKFVELVYGIYLFFHLLVEVVALRDIHQMPL